ncbi:MAG TPA: hypothetical protein VHB47_24760 [Thermoanaerobaculia bacterium]|nr:hypothetical protein [Thermoanaerobaculia bacterium]
MNLHMLAAPMIGAVNPFFPVQLQISMGASIQADGSEAPGYETPGNIVASISGDVLSVATIGQGRLGVGQTLSDLSGAILPGTLITGLLAGPGGAGSQWSVNIPQTVASEAMATSLTLNAQIQPIAWKDIQQLEGLNIEGVRWKAFLNGQVDGLVRKERKGGDLLIIPKGNRHAGQWLVAQILAQWPDWVEAAIVFQNPSDD